MSANQPIADFQPQPTLLIQALAGISAEEWARFPSPKPVPPSPKKRSRRKTAQPAPSAETSPQAAEAPTATGLVEQPAEDEKIDMRRDQARLIRTIGDRFREARELNGWSQGEAARRLGYSNSSKLSKVELATDTVSVPLHLIERAARLYEVGIDYLFGITDDWETGVYRGVQGWMLDAWEKARQRDIASLEHLHEEIAVVSRHLGAIANGAHEVSSAVDLFRARNPDFDELPASGTLVGRLERLLGSARAGELALKRFHLNLRSAGNE